MKIIIINNRTYFTKNGFLYFKRVLQTQYGTEKINYDEEKKVDGIYPPRYRKILEGLTNVNSCSNIGVERTI